jgi:hypothetical protein
MVILLIATNLKLAFQISARIALVAPFLTASGLIMLKVRCAIVVVSVALVVDRVMQVLATRMSNQLLMSFSGTPCCGAERCSVRGDQEVLCLLLSVQYL